jgi:O-antigen/teichoic acid export membrane protein
VGYLDQLVTGNLLGSTMLGLYVLAFNLASWPVTVFSQPLRSVAPAVLARLQHEPGNMQAAMTALLGVLTSLTLPMVVLLAAASGPIVRFVYGEPWAGAAAALYWLALLAGFRILFELIYDYLVVVGMTGSIMSTQLCWLAALVPALLLGSGGGIAGVAMAQLLVVAVLVLPMYLWRLNTAGVRLRNVVRQIWLPCVGSAVLLMGSGYLVDAPLPFSLGLILSAVAALAVTAGLLWLKREDVVMLRLIGKRGRLDGS